MDESYMSGYDDGVSDCDFEWKQDYEKLEQQLKEARAEIEELYSGRLGACHTCEQVAELNIKLENQLKEANGKKDRQYLNK